ncbi:hypothetical protein [Streptococcus ruminantium]|uniref:hypothetical protein n=1 Tax=Streptococcus ruminantium TaxID=1917441 RepID=UPI0012DD6151|nr:hypothetical protein [Streptococcus ruminantium]
MYKNIVSSDNYSGIAKFGEDLNNDPATVILLGKEKTVKIDFGILRFFRIISRNLFSEKFYPKILVNDINGLEQGGGVFIVDDNFLIESLKYRACGMANWFDLQHYMIVASNIVIDIIVEEHQKPVINEYRAKICGDSDGTVV